MNLAKNFDRLRHYNLKLKLSKCKFFQPEVTSLGHKITDKGILPDPSKFNTIKNHPVPSTADETRRPMKAAEILEFAAKVISCVTEAIIISTSLGLMTNQDASRKNLGGRILAIVY